MILIVDNSAKDCDRLLRQLRDEGYRAHCVRTSRDALQVFETMTPGLLVVDLFMPDVDGFQLLREVRQRPRTSRVPVIVHTISSNPADRKRATDLGANDFVTKDAGSPDELLRRVRQLFPPPPGPSGSN